MNVSAIGSSLLDAVVAAISSPPARRVFTVGSPRDPLKGEQVAVGWVRSYVGTPGTAIGTLEAQCWGPIVAEFAVRVTRCVETSTTEADTAPGILSAAGSQIADDAQAAMRALFVWSPHSDPAGEVWVGQPVGFQPQGFGAGFVLPVHVAT